MNSFFLLLRRNLFVDKFLKPDPVGTGLPNYIETKFKLDPEVGAVLAAFDDHFSYPKMMKAASYLNNPECLFVGTNPDERAPIHADLVIPGRCTTYQALF